MLDLFKRWQNGKRKALDPLEILNESYHSLSRLAAQISSHADRAPYPYMAERLRRIAGEKQSSADLLRNKMLNLGKRPEEAPLEIQSGKNHWERMAQDLNDQKALEDRFLERAALLDEKAPEIADLLRQIASQHRPHLEALLDLIARADPQAEQT